MASEFKSRLCDPNGELSDQDAAKGLRTAAAPFYRCNLKPEPVCGYPCRTMVSGAMGDKRYVIYGRVTWSEDEEQGTGPMPLVLFDAARDLHAEPLVVRVNMTRFGPGIVFKSFGVDEAERLLKSNPEYNTILLRGKTINDFRRLVGGRLNSFELRIEEKPYAYWDYTWDDYPDGQPKVVEPKCNSRGWSLRLVVDGQPVKTPVLSLWHLVRSTCVNDGHQIFTDETGDNADSISGTIVVSDGDVTLWKAHGLKPRRVWMFDRHQYRNEVLSKVRDYLNRYKTLPSQQVFSSRFGEEMNVYVGRIENLEEALYEAGENASR